MAEAGHGRISRRAAAGGIALTAMSRLLPAEGATTTDVEADAQPTFSPDGPNAVLYGSREGYPVPAPLATWRHGNPFEPHYRVGAFTHADRIYRTRIITRADAAWSFQRRPERVRYRHEGRASSVGEYLARNPVTGLLIAHDDALICEAYQYGRTDSDRMLSQSMVKSIIGLLTGIAVSEGAIRSVDDEAGLYVPGLRGFEYGSTSIRDLLHMASGVQFGEDSDGGRDLERLWADMVTGSFYGLGPPKGTVPSLVQFNQRAAPAGQRFSYASIEPDVLGAVLRFAVRRSLSDYLGDRIWRPIGAEADATWMLDAEGAEVAHFGFSAALRDWARLGRLLAFDGAWEGRQIIPAQWMIDGTTVRDGDGYLAPGRATPWLGYGYLAWLLPGPRRQFAFLGQNGQRLCVDPAARLVMVQTALDETPEFWDLWRAVVAQFASG
jgi:CubicO group peptidase (beta-lactamase class C family)